MKSSLGKHNSKFDLSEGKMSEIQDRSIENIQSEEFQGKKYK